jgi:hypothetical protein
MQHWLSGKSRACLAYNASAHEHQAFVRPQPSNIFTWLVSHQLAAASVVVRTGITLVHDVHAMARSVSARGYQSAETEPWRLI